MRRVESTEYADYPSPNSPYNSPVFFFGLSYKATCKAGALPEGEPGGGGGGYSLIQAIKVCANTRHRIALTKLRLSNHKLAIETGRYSRPFKKPAERICPICKIEMEDEYHFLNICPAYQEKRCSLLDYLEKEYRIKISRMLPNKKFMFLINPRSGNAKIQKLIAKHIFEFFEKKKGEDGKK